MLTLLMVKFIVIGFFCITLCGGCIGTGILFASYCSAIARNPEEIDTLFSIVLMGFALIETFVFMGLGLVIFVYML